MLIIIAVVVVVAALVTFFVSRQGQERQRQWRERPSREQRGPGPLPMLLKVSEFARTLFP